MRLLMLLVIAPSVAWATTVQELMEPVIQTQYACQEGFLIRQDSFGEWMPVWDYPLNNGVLNTVASNIKPGPDAKRVPCSNDPAWIPPEFSEEDAQSVFENDPDWKELPNKSDVKVEFLLLREGMCREGWMDSAGRMTDVKTIPCPSDELKGYIEQENPPDAD